ncbi:MAG: RimK/LysX family protein [Candidatus Saccharibacteria bacterium]|nr:RimK/LysX family protein [Candidatus Saccharibacteria bacterium]
MHKTSKTIIGRNVKVDFGRRAVGVPAKVDTGADGSSVWASNIRVDKDGVLKFCLFGQGSPYYNGKVFKRTGYSVAMVRSASGHQIMKFRTHFTIRLGGRRMKVLFGLSDRSTHEYPVLIGRRTLAGKFLVDVAQSEVPLRKPTSRRYNQEFKKDPYAFYKKYHQKGVDS